MLWKRERSSGRGDSKCGGASIMGCLQLGVVSRRGAVVAGVGAVWGCVVLLTAHSPGSQLVMSL